MAGYLLLALIQVVQAQSFMFPNIGISGGSNSFQEEFRAAGQSSTSSSSKTKMMMTLMMMKEEIDMQMILPLLMLKNPEKNNNIPSENMNLEEKRKLMMMMMLLCNNEETSTTMLLLMMNLHEKNRMNFQGTSDNTDLRNLQMMLMLSQMQKKKEESKLEYEVSDKTLEALNQFHGSFEMKLEELYSEWTSDDNVGVFSDFLKEKLQDLGEKTIKKVVTQVTGSGIMIWD